MPGTLLHLAFAQDVYQQCSFPINKLDFMCGNLIPDETNDKHFSHYRIPYGITGFFVPVLERAQKELLFKDDSQKLGMYCHLYLDYHFITNFLLKEFVWDYDKMAVTNPRNNRVWTLNEFFSKNGFYFAYSEMNHLLIENKTINMSMVNSIPTILPMTGMPIFDDRRSLNWKDELYGYLSEDVPYTGEILDYYRLMEFIKRTAKQFVEEIN